MLAKFCKSSLKFHNTAVHRFQNFTKTKIMKAIYKTVSSMLLVLTMALTGCKKERVENTRVPEDTTLVDGTSVADTDTTATAIESSENNIDASNAPTSNAAKASRSSPSATASAGKTSHTKKGKSLEGYSAPDGTDAENHDGDPYTKNDQRAMPSGSTSIK